jgi:hypothetical protein
MLVLIKLLCRYLFECFEIIFDHAKSYRRFLRNIKSKFLQTCHNLNFHTLQRLFIKIRNPLATRFCLRLSTRGDLKYHSSLHLFAPISFNLLCRNGTALAGIKLVACGRELSSRFLLVTFTFICRFFVAEMRRIIAWISSRRRVAEAKCMEKMTCVRHGRGQSIRVSIFDKYLVARNENNHIIQFLITTI